MKFNQLVLILFTFQAYILFFILKATFFNLILFRRKKFSS